MGFKPRKLTAWSWLPRRENTVEKVLKNSGGSSFCAEPEYLLYEERDLLAGEDPIRVRATVTVEIEEL